MNSKAAILKSASQNALNTPDHLVPPCTQKEFVEAKAKFEDTARHANLEELKAAWDELTLKYLGVPCEPRGEFPIASHLLLQAHRRFKERLDMLMEGDAR